MILLILAATLGTYTAPIPEHRDSWLSGAIDFPRSGVEKNSYTLVAVDLTVTPHGGVSSCRSRVVAGNPGMGGYTCKILQGRALFKPARDPSGRRMYGVHRDLLFWLNAEKPPPPESIPTVAHFEVKVAGIPPGTKLPVISLVQFVVDAGGTAASCSPIGVKENALAQLSCDLLGPTFRAEPARDRKGRAVPSVQNARVKLVVGEATP